MCMIILYIMQTTRCFFHCSSIILWYIMNLPCLPWFAWVRIFQASDCLKCLSESSWSPHAPKGKQHLKPSCDEKATQAETVVSGKAISTVSYMRSTLTVGNSDFLTSKKACENCWRVAVVDGFYGDLTTRNPDETVHHQPLIITLSSHWLNRSEWWGMFINILKLMRHAESYINFLKITQHHSIIFHPFSKPPRWSTWSQSTGIGSTPFREKIHRCRWCFLGVKKSQKTLPWSFVASVA